MFICFCSSTVKSNEHDSVKQGQKERNCLCPAKVPCIVRVNWNLVLIGVSTYTHNACGQHHSRVNGVTRGMNLALSTCSAPRLGMCWLPRSSVGPVLDSVGFCDPLGQRESLQLCLATFLVYFLPSESYTRICARVNCEPVYNRGAQPSGPMG